MPYMAKGDPPGTSVVAQCVELLEQVRVDQVNGFRIGLPHSIGGPTAVSAVTTVEGGCGGGGA